jgi:nucleotide-binding universal stress UspA family protein
MTARPIIVGVDPHRPDHGPPALASLLAHAYDAPVVAIAAVPKDEPADGEEALRDEAQSALAHVAAELPLGTVTHVVASDSPARAMHESVTAHDGRILVIGSAHGGPVARMRSGQTVERMLRGTRCPVAIAPPGYQAPSEGLRRIGVAFIDTPDGREALDGAAALAAGAGAALEVLTVVEWFDATGMVEPSADLIEHECEQAMELAELAAHRALERVRDLAPARAIVRAGATVPHLLESTPQLDLLVCGSRGYGPIRAALLGSVSHALRYHARCPLLVVPRDTESALEALASGRLER